MVKHRTRAAACLFLLSSALAPLQAQLAPSPQPDPDIQTGTAPTLPVVDVTATRLPEPVVESSSAITVITPAQIAEKDPFDLTDLITLAPSVSLAQSGTRGKLASLFIRGANASQTLVLIDGMRVNPPSSGAFDFGSIPAENIERIEICEVPKSALYGSDAMGGVINIITRRGSGKLVADGRVEYGSFGTQQQVAGIHGSIGRDDLSFALTHLQTAGFSLNDDFYTLGGSLRFDHPLTPGSSLSLIGRFDNGDVGAPDQRLLTFDPNERNSPRDLFASLQYNRDRGLSKDWVSLGLMDRTLLDDNPVDLITSGSGHSTNYDQVITLEAQRTTQFGSNTVTAGFEGHHERSSTNYASESPFGPFDANFSHDRTTLALFGQDIYKNRRLELTPGLRLENNSQFGLIASGRLAAGYAIADRSRIKASFGTGYRAPNLDELYYPGSGNANLRPEKSVGFDLGYQYAWSADRMVEITAYRNEFRDLIAGFPPENVDRASTSGIELGLHQHFGRSFTAVLNYGYLHTDSSPALLRRPRFTGTADLLYRHNRIHADLGLVAQGERVDNDFVTDLAARDYNGFTRVDLSGGYDLRKDLQVYIRLQNLFNQQYSEVAGFPAPLFNFVVGFKASTFE